MNASVVAKAEVQLAARVTAANKLTVLRSHAKEGKSIERAKKLKKAMKKKKKENASGAISGGGSTAAAAAASKDSKQ
ncbi:hypothetical protein SeMB42_g02980 [Synchytrium endobioticum]|uniref:Uncharacterized protein n=1 Tax=Synchytrium endobioticum TaxID=286115 RepID=A0A507DAS2_9FUNG|nr:hypothetical protein SeMB42_g02980 [Synchytrium endobioticum]